MPTERLAKKAVAFQTVVVLHTNGELDESLIPIGKEGVVQVSDLDVGGDVLDEVYGEFRYNYAAQTSLNPQPNR